MMNRMMRPNVSQFKQQEQSAPTQNATAQETMHTAYQPIPQQQQTAPVYGESPVVHYAETPVVAINDTSSVTTGSVRTTIIRAENKVTVKIGESFYGFQYTEERAVEGDVDLGAARKSLVDTVNDVIDSQISELIESMKN